MNSDENNQNQQLNYDFITNQGGDLSVAGKKPKDRRIVIIAVLTVLAVIMVSLLALTTNKSVQKAKSNEEIPVKHLRLISENQITEAIKMYSKADQISPELFQEVWVNKVFSKYDLTSCQQVKYIENNEIVDVEMFCPYKESAEGRILTYEINIETGLIEKVWDVPKVAIN